MSEQLLFEDMLFTGHEKTEEEKRAENRAKRKAYYQAHRAEACARAKRYRIANREKVKESLKRWYLRNKDRHRENGKRWAASHRDYYHKYYQDHKDEMNEQNRIYREEMREHLLGIAVRHRARQIVKHARRRSRDLRVPFDLDQHIEEIQKRIDRGFCELSGFPFDISMGHGRGVRSASGPSVDRIIPQLGYVYTNIRIVCNSINMALSNWGKDKTLAVLRVWIKKEDQADWSNKIKEARDEGGR